MNAYASSAFSADGGDRIDPEFRLIEPKSTRGEILAMVVVMAVLIWLVRSVDSLKNYYLVLWSLFTIVWACLFSPFFLSRLRNEIRRYPIVRDGEALRAGLAGKGSWSPRKAAYLFLTRRELICCPRGGHREESDSLRISLSEILWVTRGRRFRLDQDAILVHLRSGEIQRFCTSDPLTWIREIKLARIALNESPGRAPAV